MPSWRVRRIACSAALFLALATALAAQTPTRLVVFGDSLSDSGNAFALSKTTSTPPDYGLDPYLVPSAPYGRGGRHFSNGPTWIEQLARSLGLSRYAQPAFQNVNPQAANYAVGAARAYDDGRNFNLSAQVQAFLQDVGGVAPPDALYIIQFGGNDLRDALVAFSNGQNGAPILQAAIASIATNLTVLYAAGAREFLVWNAPDISLTPAIRLLSTQVPGAGPIAAALTHTFNAALAGTLAQLAALPGIRLQGFDAFALLAAVVSQPPAFALANVVSACVMPNVPPFACRSPEVYFFWDGIHPTTAGHAVIAREVAALLEP